MAKTLELPDRPFLTERFSPEGGGIDFLGLAQVNLHLLENYLIPGINNATRDLGTYFVATWIAWKFRELTGQETFTARTYRRFREAVEVALSYTLRNGSPSNVQYGPPRNLVGSQQKYHPPAARTFDDARRDESNTLFSAPLYGPSLRYLGLIAGDALARDGTSTGIPLAAEDKDTERIVQEVDRWLADCPDAAEFVRLKPTPLDGPALDRLGLHGLNPACYRRARAGAKRSFLRKFLVPSRAGDWPDQRRRTARLILASVGQHAFKDLATLRAAWYTGRRPDGEPLDLEGAELRRHRELWALFQARQIQRTILEVLLRCFELALLAGCWNVDDVVAFWRSRSPEGLPLGSDTRLGDFIRSEVATVSRASDWDRIALAWHGSVHGDHPLFDDIPEGDEDEELGRALCMLARWWVRLHLWLQGDSHPEVLGLGGRDRMSMAWFAGWIEGRLDRPIDDVVRQLFADAVFAQHLRVALARFDGRLQRLHFLLGDRGLEPTAEAWDKLGRAPTRMADRLAAFVGLLRDLDVLQGDEGQSLRAGENAVFVLT
jgi:hypothetical protein